MPDVSILIPHYHSDTGARALKAILPVLVDNTTLNYELVIRAHREREFIAWNDMARHAAAEWLILAVSDQFVAPGWDVALWSEREAHTIVTMNVVESGYYPTPDFSLVQDFGRTPETFERAAFEAWVSDAPPAPDFEAWAFPWLIHRDAFLGFGSFPLHRLDSQMTEMYFWQDWKLAGNAVKRVNGYAYHLVAWTLTGEDRHGA